MDAVIARNNVPPLTYVHAEPRAEPPRVAKTFSGRRRIYTLVGARLGGGAPQGTARITPPRPDSTPTCLPKWWLVSDVTAAVAEFMAVEALGALRVTCRRHLLHHHHTQT